MELIGWVGTPQCIYAGVHFTQKRSESRSYFARLALLVKIFPPSMLSTTYVLYNSKELAKEDAHDWEKKAQVSTFFLTL